MIIVSIFYSLNFEFLDILYTFKIYILCFWSLEIIFVIIFMKKYFVIKFYNYQKCSLIFMKVIASILLIISSFFPVMEGNADSKCLYDILISLTNNNYFVFTLLIILINSMPIFISYARVRTKILIDFKYISPYIIIIFVGIFGLIFSIIELLFGTFFKYEEQFYDYCVLESSEKIKYIDNIILYFEKLNAKDYKELFMEILLLLPIFLVINFFEILWEFWIIYLKVVKLKKGKILAQFFITEAAEITSIICYMIYLQIIELRFCGLDTYLDRNLLLLSNEESSEG